MMYPEMRDIARSFLLALLFGSSLGVLRPLQDELIDFLYCLFTSPVRMYHALKDGQHIGCAVRLASYRRDGSSPRWLFLADLIFVTFSGIGFILLLYVTTDGVFRFFMLFTVISAGLVAYSLFGRFFGKAVKWLLSFPLAVENFLVYASIKSVGVIFCHHINARNSLTK